MNAAQIHLALNHAPLFLSILGGGILILGMIKRNESLKNLSLFLLVAAAILTIPVFLTGEGTEELVEHLPGVNESAIERHEDMAKISMVIIAVTGLISLAGLLLKKYPGIIRFIYIGTLILSFASFGTMAQTAHLGGLIRHSELQNGTAANAETNEEEENNNEKIIRQQGKAVKDSLKQIEKINKNDDD